MKDEDCAYYACSPQIIYETSLYFPFTLLRPGFFERLLAASMDEINNPLKTAWIRQLKEDWRLANYSYFKDKMRLPHLCLSSSEGILGQWKGGFYRSLSISMILIHDHRWGYVQEVLFHEMAHQYVEEVLGILEERPHGETFKAVCLEHGIDPSATGRVQPWLARRKKSAIKSSENHKMIDKVNKLLALAQSTNAHEAQNAMAKAQAFLLKHNLSLLETQTERKYTHKQIGRVGRRNPIRSIISAILSRFFFVEAIWTFGYDPDEDRSGRVLEICGTPENVEMAEYVYDYLQNTSELLWTAHKKKEQISENRHRRTFIYGLLDGFYKKLEGRMSENGSKNLVWKGDPQLAIFTRRRNPRLVRSSSKYSRSCKDAYRSGVTQGHNLVIHKGIHEERNGGVKLLTHVPMTDK